ncbi:glutathione S-transferase A-like [Branchiostoma floridae]|uniref:Glutathione S-transferase A-like n=1 Tax=Branchiostoma floridae TaxID=7739 RepID=A0A9J7LWC0_BRAFL|nr:glutathione S-transferase A-like [Branchiostoma floridae]
MASEVSLYWASGSVPSMSVLIALEEKGIPYNSKEVSFADLKSEEILKLNPRGQVPILSHGELLITESLAICLYVEKAFESTSLIPNDVIQQAAVLQHMLQAQTIGVESTSICCVREEEGSENVGAADNQKLAKEIDNWEAYLTQGSYITGGDFTMADVVFFPVLAYLVWEGTNLDGKYPKLATYYNMVRERPSVKTSWPAYWGKTSPSGIFKNL